MAFVTGDGTREFAVERPMHYTLAVLRVRSATVRQV